MAVFDFDAWGEGFVAGGAGDEFCPAGGGACEAGLVVVGGVGGDFCVGEVAVLEEVFDAGELAVFGVGVGGVELGGDEGGCVGSLVGAVCAVGVAFYVVYGFEVVLVGGGVGDEVEWVVDVAGGCGGDVEGVAEVPGEPGGELLVWVVEEAAEFACVGSCVGDEPGGGVWGALVAGGAEVAAEESEGVGAEVF